MIGGRSVFKYHLIPRMNRYPEIFCYIRKFEAFTVLFQVCTFWERDRLYEEYRPSRHLITLVIAILDCFPNGRADQVNWNPNVIGWWDIFTKGEPPQCDVIDFLCRNRGGLHFEYLQAGGRQTCVLHVAGAGPPDDRGQKVRYLGPAVGPFPESCDEKTRLLRNLRSAAFRQLNSSLSPYSYSTISHCRSFFCAAKTGPCPTVFWIPVLDSLNTD